MMEKRPSQIIAEKLDGKKTYIIGFLIVIMTIAQSLGVIDAEAFITIIGILLGLGTICLRDAIRKIQNTEK